MNQRPDSVGIAGNRVNSDRKGPDCLIGYKPNQCRTPSSTKANCYGESVPSFRISLAWGTVTRFWASNTPFFRNLASTAISYGDPRGLVVWATKATRARVVGSGVATLKTRQGLTFAINPKSTNHTSPRLGMLTGVRLAFV